MQPSSDTAARLVALGVATLHEAAGRRGLMRGVRLLVGQPFAAPAATVALAAGDNLGVHAALLTARPGQALCIASGGQGAFGVIGDLVQAAAAARGLAALVVDDAIRDAAQLACPPAIAARGVCAQGTRKRRFVSIGEPVAVGGVLVWPGDWIVGDCDGVCVLPEAEIDRLIMAAHARVEKEDGVRAGLARGHTTAELLGLETLIAKRT